MLYFEKNCEIIFFRSLTLVSEGKPKIISIGPNLAQNANKMSFPFNFTKMSKGRHFMVARSKILKLLPETPFDTSFQNGVLVSLQLFSFVCYWAFLSYVQWNKRASSTAGNFHNNWPLHVKFLETKSVWQNIWLMES